MTTGQRREDLLGDVLGVLGRERQLVGAGADADGVQQGVLARPAEVGGLALGAHGVGVQRHVGAPVCRRCRRRHHVVTWGHDPGLAVHAGVRAGLGQQLGDGVADLGRVVDGRGARAAGPALGDGQELAGRLEDPTGHAAGLLRGQPRDDRGDPVRRPRLAGLVVLRRRAEALGHAGQGLRGRRR